MYAQQQGPGDAGEFGDLYRRYCTRLVRYCGRRLGNESEAEDAAHEAMLRALQAWSRFDRAADPWPWLATIAARVCADMRRRSARVPAAEGHVGADVHDQAVARLRASIIDDALGRLPARYRNPLVLKEYAGWSYRDIAELEGTTVASVRSNIMRSRRHLGARVEALARTRGQWPLPAAVPEVAVRVRTRWQAWRHHLATRGRRGLARMVDPATVVTGLVLAMQPLGATAAMGTVAAVAVIGAVAPNVERADAPGVVSVRREITAAATAVPGVIEVSTESVPPTPSAPASAPAVSHLATSRETLTRIEAPDGPGRAVSVAVGAAAEVQASQRSMWVRTDVEVHTPFGDERRHRQTTLPCGPSEHDSKRPACTAASDALRPLPGG